MLWGFQVDVPRIYAFNKRGHYLILFGGIVVKWKEWWIKSQRNLIKIPILFLSLIFSKTINLSGLQFPHV